jgi:UDP-N-acetylmuramate--alanine ligase
MHIYFSGIGGTGIGPLALIAKQAGYQVSGSDKQDSQYLEYLKRHGITNISIGQEPKDLLALHQHRPVDWFIHTSVLDIGKTEFEQAKVLGIKTSKRDELLNHIIQEKGLKMIAVAGTHGKTTTTAMLVWLFKELGLPISYSVGAKIGFGEMGEFNSKSEYFIYECDEFDRNFLRFEPHLSVITGVSWDHHEIFPTREDYQDAFREFIEQSQHTLIWQADADYLGLDPSATLSVLKPEHVEKIELKGLYNRLDALLACEAVRRLSGQDTSQLAATINRFPGLQRRMEQIVPNLYTDYAHTPEKIRGAMSVALEMAADKDQNVVVVYEPLTNRRQHYMMGDYQDCFNGAMHVYWVPSYLAREDPAQRIIPPEELISHLSDPAIATPSELNKKLKNTIQSHLDSGDMVVAMTGGGGNSLDEWLRKEFRDES